MEYNSDYEVRLATLGALGGDTTKKYDSVYSIDLEILKLTEQGGGGGGGESNYYIKNSYNELSTITGAKNGAIAYVKEHTGLTSATTVEVDYYDLNAWLVIEADYGNNTKATFSINHEGGVCVSYGSYGHFKFNNDSWIWNVLDNLDKLPADFIFDNGIEGTYISRVSGDTYEQYGDWKDTVIFYPLNGVIPTISVYPAEGSVEVVSSASTSGEITVYIPALGWYIYNDAVSGDNKWLEYKIYLSSLTDAELAAMMDRYMEYKQEMSILVINTQDSDVYEDCYVEAHAGQPYDNNDQSNRHREVTFVGNMTGRNGRGIYPWYIVRNNGDTNHQWKVAEIEWKHVVTDDNVNEIRNDIKNNYVRGIDSIGSAFGRSLLYNIAMSGSAEMEVYKLTINSNQYDVTEWTNIGGFYNNRNGGDAWCDYKNGMLRVKDLYFDAAPNPDWQIIDYNKFTDNNQNKWNCIAVKITDDSNDKYSIWFAIPAITGESRYDESYYEMRINEWEEEWKRNWVQQTNETFSLTPHLYTTLNIGPEGNINKLVQLI